MFLTDFPHEEHGGTTLPLRRPVFSDVRRLAGSCEYDTVSPCAFQPGTCGRL